MSCSERKYVKENRTIGGKRTKLLKGSEDRVIERGTIASSTEIGRLAEEGGVGGKGTDAKASESRKGGTKGNFGSAAIAGSAAKGGRKGDGRRLGEAGVYREKKKFSAEEKKNAKNGTWGKAGRTNTACPPRSRCAVRRRHGKRPAQSPLEGRKKKNARSKILGKRRNGPGERQREAVRQGPTRLGGQRPDRTCDTIGVPVCPIKREKSCPRDSKKRKKEREARRKESRPRKHSHSSIDSTEAEPRRKKKSCSGRGGEKEKVGGADISARRSVKGVLNPKEKGKRSKERNASEKTIYRDEPRQPLLLRRKSKENAGSGEVTAAKNASASGALTGDRAWVGHAAERIFRQRDWSS